MEEDKEKNLD
jgi:uncharacterized coiled-coil DUF342 family protein